MIDLINDIESSLKNNNIRCSLGMALILPDICGQIEYPNDSIKDRYVKWCKCYLYNQGFLPDCIIDLDNPNVTGEHSRINRWWNLL